MIQPVRLAISAAVLLLLLAGASALAGQGSATAHSRSGAELEVQISLTAPPTAVSAPTSRASEVTSTVSAGPTGTPFRGSETPTLPTIHYFTCLPCEILKGEGAVLNWDLSGATAAYLDGRGVAAPGSTVVAPDQTTTYRLIAVSPQGSVERLVTVTVVEGGDPETVSKTLRRPGYDVRWVGNLPLAAGADTTGVIMVATGHLGSQEVADQYFEGLRALYENYPGQYLTVGLYDRVRYITFVTVGSAEIESLLRGETDGYVFWHNVIWNMWDEWTLRWLESTEPDFARKSFASKDFGY